VDTTSTNCDYSIEGLGGYPVTETEAPQFKIESFDDLRRVMTIAKGGNPDAVQAVTDFMDLKSNIERSYFPDKKTTIAVGQLEGYGQLYFPNTDWDPFRLVSEAIAIAFMPYKGFKSNQFVDMTKQTPTLSDLKTLGESQERGFVDKLLGRGKDE